MACSRSGRDGLTARLLLLGSRRCSSSVTMAIDAARERGGPIPRRAIRPDCVFPRYRAHRGRGPELAAAGVTDADIFTSFYWSQQATGLASSWRSSGPGLVEPHLRRIRPNLSSQRASASRLRPSPRAAEMKRRPAEPGRSGAAGEQISSCRGLLRRGLRGGRLGAALGVAAFVLVRRPWPSPPSAPASPPASAARRRLGARRLPRPGRLAQRGAGLAGGGLRALGLGRLAGGDASLGGLGRGGLAGPLAARPRSARSSAQRGVDLGVSRDLRRAAALGWIAPAWRPGRARSHRSGRPGWPCIRAVLPAARRRPWRRRSWRRYGAGPTA